MSTKIAAKGYTRVVLVLNMKRFVRDVNAKKRFETVRGSSDFAEALHTIWPEELQSQSRFVPIEDEMKVEDVGFATGVFRSLMLERHTSPTYILDKDQIRFPPGLEDNFQFKTLFKRAWERWEIRIRPTMTGFFVLQLDYKYQQSPRTIIDIAKDALKLQESLDVPSAVRWLTYNRRRYENEPEKLAQKEHSVKELLAWLGADVDNPQDSEILYYPVQWKLAVEVINLFVGNGRLAIPHQDGKVVFLPSPRSQSLPLHDSFIIYHFDEILADPSIVDRAKRSKGNSGAKVSVSLNDMRKSNQLRNALVSLMEGTVLRDPCKSDDELDNNGYFPAPRWSRADALLTDPQSNLASWNDELCIFNSHTAIIYPSNKWREYEIAISTVPSATLQVQYARYWEAIIRMIEFVLEVNVLVKLIESDSYRLLTQIADTIEGIRADMFNGDIVIEGELKEQMARAAHLRRIAALAQSISHPPFWGRAEYAIQKAERLFALLDVPRILTHIERNIESINSVADHVDELYIADLSEKSNDKATMLSIGLAALSFIVTLLALPSFWYDLTELQNSWLKLEGLYWLLLVMGTALGLGLVLMALLILVMAMRRQGIARLFQGFLFRQR